MHARHALRLLAPLAFASAATFAQGKVWVVDDDGGPGVDFADLAAAVSAAADGDVLLVKTGGYGDLILVDRALTVIADEGASAQVGHVRIEQLGAARTASVVGLDGLDASVLDCDGTVWIDGSTFAQPISTVPQASDGVRISNSSAVVLTGVSARGQDAPFVGDASHSGFPGPGQGAYVSGSTVAAFGCSFKGATGSVYSLVPGGPSFEVSAANGMFAAGPSEVHLSSCDLEGGDGLPLFVTCYSAAGGIGLFVYGLGVGCPVVATNGCVLEGGPGGVPAFPLCPPGADGAPLSIVGCGSRVDVPIAPLTMTLSSPVRESTALDVALHGPPGAPVVLGVSTTPDAVLWPELGAPLALSPAAPVLVVALGVTSATGDLVVSLPLPALPPAWDSAGLFAQGLYVDPAGQPALGGARELVLLDESL